MGKNKNNNNIDLNKPKEINLNKYEDSAGLSLKKIKIGFWFVKNRDNFIKGTILILLICIAIFFIYSIYNYTYYFIKGQRADEEMATELAQFNIINQEYKTTTAAKDLIVSPAQALVSDGGYDLINKIENINDKYWANFTYCFMAQDKELACAKSYIFPNESKYLLLLAQDLDYRPGLLKLKFKDIFWTRINLHKYPDWNKFYQDHTNFALANIKFEPGQSSGLSEKLNLNTLEFDITNNTAYSYWQLPLNIVLFNRGAVVGVNRYLVEEFYSGTDKSIRMVWPGFAGNVDKVEIKPDINIIQDDIYIRYGSEIGEEK